MTESINVKKACERQPEQGETAALSCTFMRVAPLALSAFGVT